MYDIHEPKSQIHQIPNTLSQKTNTPRQATGDCPMVLSYPAPAHQVCCYLGKNSGEGVSLKIGQRGDAPYPSWMASIEFRELEGGSPNTTTVFIR